VPTALGPGPIRILEHAPAPNPNPDCIAVELAAPVDDLELSVYSVGMECVGIFTSGPQQGPWCRVEIPADFKASASNGIYYYRIVARRNGIASAPVNPGKFMILR
jgi:hypothetical protein